ncbi:hypothetical protein [Candidatus Cytomitobacter primus]|uniref:Uncharacterized protein n=1 Tax=Candidatus Cytomitobacter primus TaxID=2066024 RepID=A0A5C0UG12_9PROT|nr:hypothetical protein [Candidatus Cytomitobacter primus]QEK38573.1 hypothetical protein FZC34_01450 [Candidatus Cytomitobacter primus]
MYMYNIIISLFVVLILNAKVNINETVDRAIESFFQEHNLEKYSGKNIDASALFIQNPNGKSNYLLNIIKEYDKSIDHFFSLGECIELTEEQTKLLKSSNVSRDKLYYAISISNLTNIIKNSIKSDQKASAIESIKMHYEIEIATGISDLETILLILERKVKYIQITEKDIEIIYSIVCENIKNQQIISSLCLIKVEEGTLCENIINAFQCFSLFNFKELKNINQNNMKNIVSDSVLASQETNIISDVDNNMYAKYKKLQQNSIKSKIGYEKMIKVNCSKAYDMTYKFNTIIHNIKVSFLILNIIKASNGQSQHNNILEIILCSIRSQLLYLSEYIDDYIALDSYYVIDLHDSKQNNVTYANQHSKCIDRFMNEYNDFIEQCKNSIEYNELIDKHEIFQNNAIIDIQQLINIYLENKSSYKVNQKNAYNTYDDLQNHEIIQEIKRTIQQEHIAKILLLSCESVDMNLYFNALNLKIEKKSN